MSLPVRAGASKSTSIPCSAPVSLPLTLSESSQAEGLLILPRNEKPSQSNLLSLAYPSCKRPFHHSLAMACHTNVSCMCMMQRSDAISPPTKEQGTIYSPELQVQFVPMLCLSWRPTHCSAGVVRARPVMQYSNRKYRKYFCSRLLAQLAAALCSSTCTGLPTIQSPCPCSGANELVYMTSSIIFLALMVNALIIRALILGMVKNVCISWTLWWVCNADWKCFL